jgi:prepilin-type N-terminal cleavage/methylation domain-containing protein
MIAPPPKNISGFTLVEMTIVLLIVTLLLSGLVPTISSQIEQRQTNETLKQLDEIQQALIGYAVTYGRLPCPASPTSNGIESPATGTGICDYPYNGFIPAATLGIATVADSKGNKGYAVDSWGNRIHYAVTTVSGNTFTILNGMNSTGISGLVPDLLVCSTASTTNTSCSVTNSALTSNPGVPVVIFSTGKNGGYGGTGADETENTNNNRIFVSHVPSPVSASNGEFDDLVVWISPNILINRMVSAGKLP